MVITRKCDLTHSLMLRDEAIMLIYDCLFFCCLGLVRASFSHLAVTLPIHVPGYKEARKNLEVTHKWLFFTFYGVILLTSLMQDISSSLFTTKLWKSLHVFKFPLYIT